MNKMDIAKVIGVTIGYFILVFGYLFWFTISITVIVLACFLGFKLAFFLLGLL